MSALQIKCYLLPKTGVLSTDLIAESKEIRRFTLAQTTNSGLYNELKEKIVNSYGDRFSSGEEFKTYWLDEESEFVRFSTDNELQYAIDLHTALKVGAGSPNPSMFKVFIVQRLGWRRHCKRQEAASSEVDENEPVWHPGVICDSCTKGIIGVRYKCSTCPDYDLCSECKPKGIHSHHQFMTIEKPMGWGSCFFPGRQRGLHGKAWSHFMQQRHQQAADRASCSSSTKTSQNPFNETIKNFMPYLASSMPIVNDPKQLECVAGYLKQFLDPLGIDVTQYMQNLSRANEEFKNPSKDNEKTSNEKNEKPTENAEKPITTESKLTPTSSSMDSSVKTATTSNAADSSIKMNSQFETVGKLLESVTEEKDRPKETGDMVDVEKELKFISCIAQLRAMGYTDDAGWLTRLVVSKEGNINAVLDSLNPIKN
jgi:sequestosome 1